METWPWTTGTIVENKVLGPEVECSLKQCFLLLLLPVALGYDRPKHFLMCFSCRLDDDLGKSGPQRDCVDGVMFCTS